MIRYTYVIGDIHGNFKALQDVLDKIKYDPKQDRLICVGDYVDGYPDSYLVVEKLIQLNIESDLKNIYLLGNHDDWMADILNNDLRALQTGQKDIFIYKYAHHWTQGGSATFFSYKDQIDPIPDWDKHVQFFNDLKLYHIENNILFIHAGWDVELHGNDFKSAVQVDPDSIIWDRTLFSKATHLQHLLNKGYPVNDDKTQFGGFDKIFIGHTAVSSDFITEFPNLKVCNIHNVDTGAGFKGKLTAYRLEDGEIFQSDLASNYYTFNPRA